METDEVAGVRSQESGSERPLPHRVMLFHHSNSEGTNTDNIPSNTSALDSVKSHILCDFKAGSLKGKQDLPGGGANFNIIPRPRDKEETFGV